MVIGEIQGKDQAIHAYDQILWTIRSGYLAIFFAAWGLLLSAYADPDQQATMEKVLPALKSITIGLTIGGFVVDLSYLYRKFRVIHDVTALMRTVVDYSGLEDKETFRRKIRPYMRISGEIGISAEIRMEIFRSLGWWLALLACLLVYLTPMFCLVVGLGLANIPSSPESAAAVGAAWPFS